MRIEPAELAFDSEGTPYSSVYGDVYHSAQSGPGQAQHVFVAGNDLPRRWAHARVFTILETGFGLGLNFLATWRQWRDDPARPQRLHYVSIVKHPFERGSPIRAPPWRPTPARRWCAKDCRRPDSPSKNVPASGASATCCAAATRRGGRRQRSARRAAG